jgi:hypothetical protein
MFQSSSVQEFNKTFRHIEKERYINLAKTSSSGFSNEEGHWLTPAGIFLVASNQYRSIWEEGTWTRFNNKEEATFNTIALYTKTLCWRSGEQGYRLTHRPHPCNNNHINMWKKLLKDKKEQVFSNSVMKKENRKRIL